MLKVLYISSVLALGSASLVSAGGEPVLGVSSVLATTVQTAAASFSGAGASPTVVAAQTAVTNAVTNATASGQTTTVNLSATVTVTFNPVSNTLTISSSTGGAPIVMTVGFAAGLLIAYSS